MELLLADMVANLIFLFMVASALTSPRIFGFRLGFAGIGILGLLSAVATKVLSVDTTINTITTLLPALATILSLMLMVGCLVAVGLMDKAQRVIVRLAREDSARLLTLLFWSGAVFGAFFTNDAAILLMTPLVIRLCRAREGVGDTEDHLPFLFAILYVGNLVGVLVISNPINVVAATIFDISFVEYFLWMFLPALASMFVSWWGLLIAFRKPLRKEPKFLLRNDTKANQTVARPKTSHQSTVGVLLLATLIGFSLEGVTDIPIWVTAVSGAVLISSYTLITRGQLKDVVARVDIPILVFMACIFTVAVAVRDTGSIDALLVALEELLRQGTEQSIVWVSYLCAAVAAGINNHSTVSLMVWLIESLSLDAEAEKMMVLASLVGADLGPKMLPIGSLAAMMWLSMVESNGFKVSIWTYIKIGVPVTVVSVGLSALILVAEFMLLAKII